jgi:hypothetical protein
MFGTNWPQLGWKACVDRVNECLVNTQEKGFKDKSTLEQFMGGNAIRVMKLPTVALSKLKSKI